MGVVAHTVQEKLGDGSVLGVMPEALIPREITGDHIGQLKIVPDMHTRKVVRHHARHHPWYHARRTKAKGTPHNFLCELCDCSTPLSCTHTMRT